MIHENGVLLTETERFPEGPRRRWPTSTSTCCAPSGPGWAPSTTTGATTPRGPTFREIRFRLEPPTVDIGLRRSVERFPFVPSDDARLAQDCYEAYNIQVSGLEQRLRAIGDPKVVIGVSGGLDSTHALIVAARAMDRLGAPAPTSWPSPCPASPPASAPEATPIRLADALGVTFETIDITETARLMLDEPRPPVRPRRAPLRRHVRERAGRAAHRLPVPSGEPARRDRARHRRPVRAGPRMVHVRGRRPDVALQRQRRRPEDADPAPDPLGRVAAGLFDDEVAHVLTDVLDTEISPELVPHREDEEIQSSEANVGPYALQDFNLFHVLRYGFRPGRRSRSWPGTPGTTRRPASGRQGFPVDERPPTTSARSATGSEVFVQRFFGFSQFKRSALPNGPKVVARRLAVAARRLAGAVGPVGPASGWRTCGTTFRRSGRRRLEPRPTSVIRGRPGVTLRPSA